MAPGIPFVTEMAFDYGVVQQVAPGIRRIVAGNPGGFTFHGTGTYIVGHGEVAVIDPGPALAEHVDAVLAALEGETITHQLITHTHSDHSPAARLVKQATGAPTYGYGPHGGSQPESGPAVEEGADREFAPDVVLRDGDRIEGAGWAFTALHTPGHTSNHLCFALDAGQALFTGDHVMGWSTSVISPPDGDMRSYMASLRRLLDREDRLFWPTHGPPIHDPRRHVEAFIAHREAREQQVLDCLRRGVVHIAAMVPEIYPQLPTDLWPAASRSLYAHLIHLVENGHVTCDGAPAEQSTYALTELG